MFDDQAFYKFSGAESLSVALGARRSGRHTHLSLFRTHLTFMTGNIVYLDGGYTAGIKRAVRTSTKNQGKLAKIFLSKESGDTL